MVYHAVPQKIIEALRFDLTRGKHILRSLPCVFDTPEYAPTSEVDGHEHIGIEIGREINSSDAFDHHAADAGSNENRLSAMSPRLVLSNAVPEFTLIDIHRLVAGEFLVMHGFDSALQPRMLEAENTFVLAEDGTCSNRAAEVVVGDTVSRAAAYRGSTRVAQFAFEVAAPGVGHVNVSEVVVSVLVDFGRPQRAVRVTPAIAAEVEESSSALIVAFRHAEHAYSTVVVLSFFDALSGQSHELANDELQ